ncbi:hypothetical protein Taro_053815 [Colocasia esculenta]|uniref:NPR1/NIM1-like C-terminal domain-containing protein n=1 Tax=Colocasia esculenta TaxID=4460 RepID=A0A843XPB9_COLES|nr:hypothetical protein [Colocasia esculenta]
MLIIRVTVAFARLFFPTEAKVAMELAQAEKTCEFAGLFGSKGSSSNLKDVDLNETPSAQNKRLRSRMEALTKTVELGRRYFPNCSQVLDKFMEDDHTDFFFLERGTPDEQKLKRTRFIELKDDVHKAFTKDKAESGRSGLSSSSSSSSSQKGERKQNRVTRKWAALATMAPCVAYFSGVALSGAHDRK